MENPIKRVQIIEDMSKRLVAYSHIDDMKLASEIARKWFKS